MLLEHDHAGGRIGSVTSSWEGPRGELRVSGIVSDPAAVNAVRNGSMRELSLGTSVHSEDNGNVLMRTHDELSLCERAARPGCILTEVDGRTVGYTHRFARRRGVCAHPPCPHAPSTMLSLKRYNL